MSINFILIPNTYCFPKTKQEQIDLVFRGSVREAVYKTLQQSPNVADYSDWLSVTYDDLLKFLLQNKEYFHSLLPTDSWDSFSVKREGDTYSFCWYDRGKIYKEDKPISFNDAAVKLLELVLMNQSIRKLKRSPNEINTADR